MTPERYQQIRGLFHTVVDLDPPARAARLDAACREDAELRDEVESLLAESDRLPMSGEAVPTADLPSRPVKSSPRPIGPYHIKRVLGAGGMGTVYIAQQEHPRRTVALKVLKSGIVSPSALRRFEYESQILARLQHPNIAQVFEAGTHVDGETRLPYFAMEYIPNAREITTYVNEKDLRIGERLELFAKVCAAVHHGHQRGVIHRDLKPGNILVDSSGEPKIIDFGVARASDSDMAVTTLQTDVGQLIGTLQYMSPEQCDADPIDLDIRSDVYALGVVLYEVLCGRLPYEIERAAVHEAVRIIREEKPAAPSSFDRTLRGDLETITLKALEKDRNRRYRSALDLADEIGRYLRNEPIIARPPSVVYQFRMFARRNKVAFRAVTAVLAAILIGLVASLLLLRQSITAREQAERHRDRKEFLFATTEDFLDRMHDGATKSSLPLEARLVLAEEALRYVETLGAEASDDVDMRLSLANGHRRLSQVVGGISGPNLAEGRDAMHFAEEALAIHESIGEIAPDLAANLAGQSMTLRQMGGLWYRRQQWDEARKCYERGLALAETLLDGAEDLDDYDARRLVALHEQRLGDVALKRDDIEPAAVHFTRALELFGARAAEHPDDAIVVRDFITAKVRRAEILARRGDVASAREAYHDLLAQRRRQAEMHPRKPTFQRDVMVSQELLVKWLLKEPADLNAAAAALDEAHRIAKQLLADSLDARAEADLARVRVRYGNVLVAVGEVEEGRAIYDAGLADYDRLAADHPDDVRYARWLKAWTDHRAAVFGDDAP